MLGSFKVGQRIQKYRHGGPTTTDVRMKNLQDMILIWKNYL
jgi:hypothetical protein